MYAQSQPLNTTLILDFLYTKHAGVLNARGFCQQYNMSSLENSYNKASARRQLVRFTPFTRFHHPCLNSDFNCEDIDLVPGDLCPRGGLSWELPHPYRSTNDGEQDAQHDTSRFVHRFQTWISSIQSDVNDLEEFVLAWARKSKTSLVNEDGRQREDQLTDSTTVMEHRSVSPSSLCTENLQSDDVTCPNINTLLPLSGPESEASLDDSTSDDFDNIYSSSEVKEVQPLGGTPRRRRSFGPYESFWYVLPYSAYNLRHKKCKHVMCFIIIIVSSREILLTQRLLSRIKHSPYGEGR